MIRRFIRTLMRVRPVQIWGRLVSPLRRRLTQVFLSSPPEGGTRDGREALVDFPCHDPWNERDALKAGVFRFLGFSRRLGWPPDWQPDDVSLLWRFNLHYQEYLHLLEPAARLELCRHWRDSNLEGRGVAWHPYVLSRRIRSWRRSLPRDAELERSLWRQAQYLSRNVERHVLGNHLLENARALILAAEYFGAAGKSGNWRKLGLEILREETPEQVLSDGGHFERSPMYHALMLELYLDVLNVLGRDCPDRPWFEGTARKMADFLDSVTHPDGGVSLLNDSTLEIAPPPERLLAYARDLLAYEPRRRAASAESGYYVWNRDPVWLVVDGGPVGPDYLPAHAHADIFSYELSLHGQRLVVDTGVSTYEAGPARDRERGTGAHNTVCVDGVDQAEVWGSFRVARRYPPENVRFSADERSFRFEGEFGGYAHLIGDGIRHRREMRGDSGDREIHVEEAVGGHGQHRVESRIHLHPDVRLERAGDGFRLRRGNVDARLIVDAGRVSTEPSVYCPEFGREIPSTAIVLSADSLPARLAYRILY